MRTTALLGVGLALVWMVLWVAFGASEAITIQQAILVGSAFVAICICLSNVEK